MKVKALSPKEIISVAKNQIPEVVIQAVNNLLKRGVRSSSKSITIMQDDILKEIKALGCEFTRHQIFDNGWLDFEPIFEKVGWKIEYDKPGYNEFYEASFTFHMKA